MVKCFKKFVALATACVLMITPISVCAEGESSAEGSATGTSKVEGIVDKEVFSVVLPTIADDDTTFDFILDPQGLIAATESNSNKAYAGATFTNKVKGLFFKNTATTYSATSNKLKVTNKSTVPVDVALTATATNLTDSAGAYDIKLSEASTFTEADTDPSIYLALECGTDVAPITEDGATISTSIEAAPADAYKVKYVDGQYVYGLTPTAAKDDYTGFKSLSFDLTGACNMFADWSAAKDATPGVEVTWALTKHVGTAKPSVSSTTATYSKANGCSIPVSLGGGDLAATSVTATHSTAADGTFNALTVAATYENGTLTIPKGNWTGASAGQVRYVKLQFDDTANTSIIITVTIAN